MPEEVKKVSEDFSRVYGDVTFFIDSMMKDYDVFPTILALMRDGNASIELKKRYILRAIDETWVNAIEDVLPALDTIIRNPSKYIEEREEVMPIELSRNISVRSLQHLSQHTNLISKYEDGVITPSKILNVFREETLQTYENKFINTLISRLYAFVNRRYEIALKAGQDEKTTSLEFKENFFHGKAKVKLNMRVEIAEPAMSEEDRVERNYTHTTDLWRRVVKLNDVVTTYANSTFVQEMGRSYIRPPVMRTNAILKNKNLRQCLALWQFIEGYDEAGYSMLVQEDLEKVDEAYIKELYSTLALQYLIFRYNINNEFEEDNALDTRLQDDVFNPHIIDELAEANKKEFDVPAEPEKVAPPPSQQRAVTLTPEDMLMLTSLDVALAASEALSPEDEANVEHPSIPEPEAAEVYVSEEEKERRAAEAKAAAEEEIRRKAVEEYIAQQEAEAAARAEEEAKAAEAAKAEAEAGAAEEATEPSAHKPSAAARATVRAVAAKSFNINRVHAPAARRRIAVKAGYSLEDAENKRIGYAHANSRAVHGGKRREALDRMNKRRA